MSKPLVIEGELTVFTAHALKAQLMQALADAGPALQLELSGVSEVDGAGVQLLLATLREARQRGAALDLIAAPPQLTEALRLIDVAGEFAGRATPETEPVA